MIVIASSSSWAVEDGATAVGTGAERSRDSYRNPIGKVSYRILGRIRSHGDHGWSRSRTSSSRPAGPVVADVTVTSVPAAACTTQVASTRSGVPSWPVREALVARP